MLKAPRADRIAFYKFAYASSMFREATTILEFIERERIGDQHPLNFAMWTSFHVLYGKPFKQQIASLKLDTALIPSALTAVHADIIKGRDKMFAHADLDKFDLSDGSAMNAISIQSAGHNIGISFRYFGPSPKRAGEMHALTTTLSEKCRFHADKYMKRWSKRFFIPQGQRFLANTSAHSDDILLPWKMREGLESL